MDQGDSNLNSIVPETTAAARTMVAAEAAAAYPQLKVEVGPCSCTCAECSDQYGECGKSEYGCGYKITR